MVQSNTPNLAYSLGVTDLTVGRMIELKFRGESRVKGDSLGFKGIKDGAAAMTSRGCGGSDCCQRSESDRSKKGSGNPNLFSPLFFFLSNSSSSPSRSPLLYAHLYPPSFACSPKRKEGNELDGGSVLC